MRKRPDTFWIILMLGLLSAIGPFSIDMYLPGFHAIASDLNTSIDHVQLSLTSFFIGIASGQMIYGPLLDRFGRKKPLIVGLLIYILASVGCAFTQSADTLILLRFVQALGSCSGMVAARAMVRDYFQAEQTAKVFSMLMLVIGVSPILAPTVGGYVIDYFGWHAIFIVLAAITLIILLGVLFILPESRKPDREMSLKPGPIMQSFWTVFIQPQFLIYAFAGGIASSGLYAYLSGSPYVMMEIFGLSERQYGWVFGIIAAGLISSSQINNLMLRRFSSESIARYALLLQSVISILLLLLALSGTLNLVSCIVLIFLFLACQGFVFPNTSALALNPFSKLAGSASALLGSIQLGVGAVASVLVSVLHNNSSVPMVGVMAACACVSFAVLLAAPLLPSAKQSARQL